MDRKEIKLFLNDSLAGFEAYLHSSGLISVVVTEYQRNEEKSFEHQEYIDIRQSTEIFVDVEEAKSILRALEFLIEECETE